jgi:hypothetical protein
LLSLSLFSFSLFDPLFLLTSFLYNLLSLRREIKAVCQFVCPSVSPTNNFWTSGIDFYEIQQGGHAIEGDLDAIIFNLIASPSPNVARSNFWSECKSYVVRSANYEASQYNFCTHKPTFLYVELVTWDKESRLRVQSLNATYCSM